MVKTHFKPNPTLIGAIAVLIWGLSLSFNRIIAIQIGIPATIGIIFTAIGIYGFLNQLRLRQAFPSKAVFKNPLVYVRWILFGLNPTCVYTAVTIVQQGHLPFVILINYIWPTAIIVFSILIAGVRITRLPFFIGGTMIVIAALAIEILQPGTLGSDLFSNTKDCIAYGLALVSALSWAMYTALTRRSGQQTGGTTLIPLFQLTLGLSLPVSFLPEFNHWNHLTLGIAVALMVWSVLQFTAYMTWDFGTRHGNIVILSLCADFIPWLSLAAAHVLIGVDIGNKTILSATLLVAGATITRYGTLTKRGEKKQLEELAHEHPSAD